jgi:sugar phosphate isomerase/epimerase
MNRRNFLGLLSAAAVLPRSFSWAATEHRVKKIGVQLYTVRDQLKADFDGTIAKVAAIGYKEVEFAGYFDHTPQQVRAALDKNGLTSPACHVEYGVLGDKWPSVIESSKIIGQSYIVCPWISEEMRKQPDVWKRAADTFNKAGEISQKSGIQFA